MVRKSPTFSGLGGNAKKKLMVESFSHAAMIKREKPEAVSGAAPRNSYARVDEESGISEPRRGSKYIEKGFDTPPR